jgi:hypothetical protein
VITYELTHKAAIRAKPGRDLERSQSLAGIAKAGRRKGRPLLLLCGMKVASAIDRSLHGARDDVTMKRVAQEQRAELLDLQGCWLGCSVVNGRSSWQKIWPWPKFLQEILYLMSRNYFISI